MMNKLLGSTFRAQTFEDWIQRVFHAPVTGEKKLSVAAEKVDVVKDRIMAMALAIFSKLRNLRWRWVASNC